MILQLKLPNIVSEPYRPIIAHGYRLVALREVPLPETLRVCETPEHAQNYWHQTITANPYFKADCECFCVLHLNTRRRVKGHELVSIGTLDTLLVHPREVFRIAIIRASAAILLMHNHSSGDPSPSKRTSR
jgi:DNA repair protein RadC